MTDQPDKPSNLTILTALPLPSQSNVLTEVQDAADSASATPFAVPPTIAAPKTKAQKQREYRQRIAASRTLEQVIAARKADAERHRRRRLRKAANSALVSGSLESTTVFSSRLGAKSNDIQTGIQRQLTHQGQTPAAGPAQTTVQPAKISVKNMDMLTDYNYTLRNETAAINYLIPVTSRDVAVHDIDVKVEDDLSVVQRTIKTEERMDYDEENEQTSPLYVAIDEIKVEYDEPVNQDITDQENISSVIHDIKVETEDHDVECGSTTTKDFVTNDIKVEVFPEIITPDEFTNIEMMCRSTLPKDVGVNSVKVEDCGVMNQDGASDSATNADVKRGNVLLGEDYSSVDGLPSAETIHKVESSDTGVQQVTKVANDSMRLAHNMRSPDNNMRKHLVNKPFSCDICYKAFRYKSNYVIHNRQHTGEKPFSCVICNKSFSTKSNLIIHIRQHTGEKQFSCDICYKAFKSKGDLVRHIKIHSEERSFPCDICNKTFKSKSYLVRHIKIHSGERSFPCDICNKKFKSKRVLVGHMKLHSGERSFSCYICNKTFKLKRYLVRHIKLHSGEKLFSCDICDKAFSFKNNFLRHIRTHSEEKTFLCDICNKAFKSIGCLVNHTKVHSREKPFSCYICNKSFKSKRNLEVHTKVHSGERPFPCDICNKTFKSKSYLVRHIKKHSGGNPF